MGDFERFIEDFEKLFTDLPPEWGSPKADLPRIKKEIDKKMADIVAPREFPDLGFWYYNKHDTGHVKRVIGYLAQIIKKREIELTPPEHYLLYVAAYGHDVGMTIWDESLQEAYERAFKEQQMDTSFVRWKHAVAGGNILEKILSPYIERPAVRGAISEIVAYHSGEVDDDVARERTIEGQKVRVALLIALLRIADTMDAGEERLPNEEIIATSLALSTTCKAFRGQFEHYMRRKIVESCYCEKEGVVLTIKKGFKNFEIRSPESERGEPVTVTGKEIFLKVLEEFGKELGPPKNLAELQEKFPNLGWHKLEGVWEKRISNNLLEQYDLKIPWIVEFSGHPDDPIPVDWEQKVQKKRRRYDENPHPIEKLLAELGSLKPPIESLRLIEDALAAQDIEPDPFRPGRLFWPDIEKLSRRDEIDEILKCFEHENVVLLEGYPASGKSSIACRLGYELVQERKWVYYGNLTTGVGVNCQPEELPRKLLKEAEKIEQEVWIIIEDIHHLVRDFDQLNPITKHKNVKLLFTSRPLKQYDIDEYFGRAEGKRSSHFQWIDYRNRITLKTSRYLVEKILQEADRPFGTLDPILEIIGKKESNLLLLSFLIRVAREKGKSVDQVKIDEVHEFVRDHLENLEEQVCPSPQHRKAFAKIISTISTLSEFEIPVERDFLNNEHEIIDDVLERLIKAREIFHLKGKVLSENYYLIPHSRLARLWRKAYLDDKTRRELLKNYICTGQFFSSLVKKLSFEETDLLKDLTKLYKKEFSQKDLQNASLNKILSFLSVISRVNKELTREIAKKNREILRKKAKKEIASIDLDKIRSFFLSISQVDKELAREIASENREILKIKAKQEIVSTDIADILFFLAVVSWTDEELAREIAKENREILRKKINEGKERSQSKTFL